MRKEPCYEFKTFVKLVMVASIDKSISVSCSLFNGEKETLCPQFPFLVNSDQIFVVQIIEKIAAFVWMHKET